MRAAIDIADRAAEAARRRHATAMLAAFTRSAQYEYLFWDGAYRNAAGRLSSDAGQSMPAPPSVGWMRELIRRKSCCDAGEGEGWR